MIGILLLGQHNFTQGLLDAASHTLGRLPPQLSAVDVDYAGRIEAIDAAVERGIRAADHGDGVLILADVYGATHTNLACRRRQAGRIELVAGVNVPMLLRVLNYPDQSMSDLIETATRGGSGGIVCTTKRHDHGGST